MIILDTNVVSELMRSEPAPRVASWIRGRDRRELCTTWISLAEIRYGIARLPDGRRKQVLLDTADDIFRAFSDQVLPVDAAAAGRQQEPARHARTRPGRYISLAIFDPQTTNAPVRRNANLTLGLPGQDSGCNFGRW